MARVVFVWHGGKGALKGILTLAGSGSPAVPAGRRRRLERGIEALIDIVAMPPGATESDWHRDHPIREPSVQPVR